MAKSPSGNFRMKYFEANAHHPDLDYNVNLYVPGLASHRPAVKQFMRGRYYEAFSHLTYKMILDYKDNKNVIHAGAFFGDMIHTLSKSAGKVYAFEPVLDSYYFAKKNAQRLDLNNVILFNAGLGEENTLLTINTKGSDGTYAGGGSTFDHNSTPDGTFETAPVFRLDDLPLHDVAMIELDVEGFELFALRGGRSLIARDKPIVLIEENNNNCGEFLADLGYVFVFRSNFLRYWGTEDDVDFLKTIAALHSKAMEAKEAFKRE